MVNIYSYPEELCIIFHIISLFMLPDHSTLGRLIYPLVIHLIRDIFLHMEKHVAQRICVTDIMEMNQLLGCIGICLRWYRLSLTYTFASVNE